MFGLTLKFAYTPGFRYRANPRVAVTRRHIAPEGQSRGLCGVEVVPPVEQSRDFRFGTFDGSLCTRCRNAVLKAEDDCIYLGYDEKTVEPYLLNRYYVRNTHLAKPEWLEQWAQNMANA